MLSPVRKELLYADDLVIMAPTMEQLGRRVTEWRASLHDKGLKVNAGKSKMMVGTLWWENDCKLWKVALWCLWERSTGKLCSVHSMFKKWIHKRCSGVHGDLSWVADGFRCRRCDGDNPES